MRFLTLLCVVFCGQLFIGVNSLQAAETGKTCPNTISNKEKWRVQIFNDLDGPIFLRVDRNSWVCYDFFGSETPAQLDDVVLQPGQSTFKVMLQSWAGSGGPFKLTYFVCTTENCNTKKGHTFRLRGYGSTNSDWDQDGKQSNNSGDKYTYIFNSDSNIIINGKSHTEPSITLSGKQLEVFFHATSGASDDFRTRQNIRVRYKN